MLDRQVLRVIRLTLSRSVAHNVIKEMTTANLMTALLCMYEKPSANIKVHLMKKLFNLKMTEGNFGKVYLTDGKALDVVRMRDVDITLPNTLQKQIANLPVAGSYGSKFAPNLGAMMPNPASSAPPSAADIVASPQPSSSSKPVLTSPTPSSPAIRSPIFSAQPLTGKPINPPAPPPPPHGILYPIGAAVHRGFPVRAAAGVRAVDQLVTVANPAGYLRNSSPMAVMNFAAAMAAASQARPYVYGGVEHTAAATAAASHGMRPPPPQGQQQAHHFVAPRPGASRGASVPAHPKVTSLPAMPIVPEHSDTKERSKSIDDAFVMIHGRKVRVVDGASPSLYTLCRSWIQSGLTQETHSNVGEAIKLLPKPLPPSIVKEMLNKKVDDTVDEDLQEDEWGDSVDQLSAQELLAGHITRAKRVRARFRRERLLRIERYKQRLSLLLPAPNDIGQTNNTTAGNS
ncbi:uncharacterized protein LOC110028496 [Phalaenopsis equestris]|uniref:uncharacterized protein LOC110028496 n=1 Tax=Phalaenopsis equestris TaxID=78828 RepID=UPI0009E37AC0|nr:uncharacterized protein LOC110028496 [Phalaenopsis equestris]